MSRFRNMLKIFCFTFSPVTFISWILWKSLHLQKRWLTLISYFFYLCNSFFPPVKSWKCKCLAENRLSPLNLFVMLPTQSFRGIFLWFTNNKIPHVYNLQGHGWHILDNFYTKHLRSRADTCCILNNNFHYERSFNVPLTLIGSPVPADKHLPVW